jgi:glycerol-3-phosphate cytidylyltransferase-like family protein
VATIEQLIENLKAVNIPEVIQASVSETIEEIKNYQQQQMFFGLNAQGEKTKRLDGKYDIYSPMTVAIKRLKGQPTDRVTLRDTQDFYIGITVKPERSEVIINSSDEKTSKLIEMYGEDIFGLNKDYAAEYSTNDLGPIATNKIREQIHK